MDKSIITITVIIVNYNTADYVKQCIDSVLLQQGITFEIIVVDNASGDNSLTVLSDYQDKIQLLTSQENLGFGKANNLAAKHASGEYLFLLNPDARLQQGDDLSRVVSFMQGHPFYGLVSARVVNADGNEETKPRNNYPGEQHIGYPYKALPGQIAWVLGACMIIPKTIYEKAGGFDEAFFLYAEDADLCLRIRQAGYEVGYFPEVEVKHEGGGSEQKTSWHQLTAKKQNALIKFYEKHYSISELKALLLFELRRAKKRLFFSRLRSLLTFGLWSREKDEKYRSIAEINRKKLKELEV